MMLHQIFIHRTISPHCSNTVYCYRRSSVACICVCW